MQQQTVNHKSTINYTGNKFSEAQTIGGTRCLNCTAIFQKFVEFRSPRGCGGVHNIKSSLHFVKFNNWRVLTHTFLPHLSVIPHCQAIFFKLFSFHYQIVISLTYCPLVFLVVVTKNHWQWKRNILVILYLCIQNLCTCFWKDLKKNLFTM